MQRYQLILEKANILRQRFIDGNYNGCQLAKELRVSTITTWRYKREFEKIRAEYPDRLTDFGFYPGEPNRAHWQTPKWIQFCFIMPAVLAEETTLTLETSKIFEKYHQLSSDPYAWKTFKYSFVKWVKDNVIITPQNLLKHISNEDMLILRRWRLCNNHRLWQIAKTLDLALRGSSRKEIIEKVDTTYKTINQWIAGYMETGLRAFDLRPNPRNQKSASTIKERKEMLLKLMHETPKLYGLNRTSWSYRALTCVYNKIYKPAISYDQICRSVKQMGYSYKKTRDMLTSPDPKFRDKITKIQYILQKLKPNEKFFSIDEYGPVSVRLRGGKTLKHKTEKPDVIPENQKKRGFIICMAALELPTNQVTHFYSTKKNTFEMIKLVDVLIAQYHDQERLYLCWDAVSWHRSMILKNYIIDHNELNKPEIKLAPLPTSTQFLNVIESVFAGLARAVIHNSDYLNTDQIKEAINLHFAVRNEYFKQNPKRAGRKIWGKELVKAKFSETQHCRNRGAMLGRK